MWCWCSWSRSVASVLGCGASDPWCGAGVLGSGDGVLVRGVGALGVACCWSLRPSGGLGVSRSGLVSVRLFAEKSMSCKESQCVWCQRSDLSGFSKPFVSLVHAPGELLYNPIGHVSWFPRTMVHMLCVICYMCLVRLP